MTKETKRLVYTDSDGDEQVLGVLNAAKDSVPGGSPDATAVIKNIKVSRSLRGFNTVKVWATNEIFGEVPVEAGEFDADEPEIFLEHYDTDEDSWVREFRGYAENQGSISESGEVAFKLYSFAKFTGKVNANKTSATTTDIADAFQDILPSGYQVEVPSDVTVPSVSNYTLVDKRRKGYRELAKDHQWSFRFTPETDDNDDWIVRFEPEGYAGTVGDIRGREDYSNGDILAKKIKSWEKARTKDIVNKVEVIGKDSDNNKVVGTASDSSSIDDYGERFRRYHIDYILGGESEADDIADDKLNTSPGEGGEIKIDAQHESVINDSFDIKDSRRDIDGVFTCTEQETFYPENNDKLVFTYETDTEKRAEKDDFLESERSKIYPSSAQDLGNTDIDGETGDARSDTGVNGSVDEDPSDTGVNGSVDEDPSDTSKVGSVDDEPSDTTLNFEQETIEISEPAIAGSVEASDTYNQSVGNSAESIGSPYIGIPDYAEYGVLNVRLTTSTDDKAVRIFLEGPNDEVYIGDRIGNAGASGQSGIAFSQSHGGPVQASGEDNNLAIDGYPGIVPEDNYTLYAVGSGATSTNVDAEVYAGHGNHTHIDIEKDLASATVDNDHEHGDDIVTVDNDHPHGDDFGTVDNDHPHGDDFATDDLLHGGGSGENQHGVEGDAELGDANITNEDKTDR